MLLKPIVKRYQLLEARTSTPVDKKFMINPNGFHYHGVVYDSLLKITITYHDVCRAYGGSLWAPIHPNGLYSFEQKRLEDIITVMNLNNHEKYEYDGMINQYAALQ